MPILLNLVPHLNYAHTQHEGFEPIRSPLLEAGTGYGLYRFVDYSNKPGVLRLRYVAQERPAVRNNHKSGGLCLPNFCGYDWVKNGMHAVLISLLAPPLAQLACAPGPLTGKQHAGFALVAGEHDPLYPGLFVPGNAGKYIQVCGPSCAAQ